MRLTDDWLPLPTAAQKELTWVEGDVIQIEVIDNCAILTKLSPEDGYAVEIQVPRRTKK